MKIFPALAVLCPLLWCGCGGTPTSPSAVPDWLAALIAGFQSAPAGNPPQSVYRYTYNGRIVYYVPARCCDQFSTLYDTAGHALCAPDGGLSGHGDGRCPDFFQQRREGVLVWQDPRSPSVSSRLIPRLTTPREDAPVPPQPLFDPARAVRYTRTCWRAHSRSPSGRNPNSLSRPGTSAS
jgi:hypothetical protein